MGRWSAFEEGEDAGVWGAEDEDASGVFYLLGFHGAGGGMREGGCGVSGVLAGGVWDLLLFGLTKCLRDAVWKCLKMLSFGAYIIISVLVFRRRCVMRHIGVIWKNPSIHIA